MRYKILIVDDEKSIRDALIDILWHEGFDTDQASNGLKCLKKLNEHHFDVVVMDIKMPFLDGVQTLKHINKKYNIPVIILSGHADNQTASETIKLGAFDFLSKPFSLNQFLNTINAACKSQQEPKKSKEKIITDLRDEIHRLNIQLSFAQNNVAHCVSKIEALEHQLEQAIVRNVSCSTSSQQLILQKNKLPLNKTQLRHEIMEGHTLSVIKTLIEVLDSLQPDLTNQLIQLQAKVVTLIKQVGKNSLSKEEEKLQIKSINNRILKIIAQL